jgi:hypothetical protein
VKRYNDALGDLARGDELLHVVFPARAVKKSIASWLGDEAPEHLTAVERLLKFVIANFARPHECCWRVTLRRPGTPWAITLCT